MEDCERLLNCAFMTAYESDEKLKYALRSSVMLSCQAEEQDILIEKNLRKASAGAGYIPGDIIPARFHISVTPAAVSSAA
jgi:hypothetical protein